MKQAEIIALTILVYSLTLFMLNKMFQLGFVMGGMNTNVKLSSIKLKSVVDNNVIKYPFPQKRETQDETENTEA